MKIRYHNLKQYPNRLCMDSGKHMKVTWADRKDVYYI